MKKIVSIFIALSISCTGAITTISCDSGQKTLSYKDLLKNVIEEAEKFIDKVNDVDEEKLLPLKNALQVAKWTYEDGISIDEDYIKATVDLHDELKDYQNPGYKIAKRRLDSLVETAYETIKNDNNGKSKETIRALKEALDKANKALQEENDPIELKFIYDELRGCLDNYENDKQKYLLDTK